MNEILIFLVAAVILVPLASKLKLGSVMGYLLAGITIGPFGLALVHDPQAILHLSEFGVVLMLFLIGLELDTKRLWAMRSQVFGGGSLQLLVCGLLLSGALFTVLDGKAALIAGLTLALSSTAIAVQFMKERNLLSAPLGTVAFAILLFQDIAAIPIIAIVPMLGTHSGTGPADPLWLSIAKALAAIATVIVIGRYLTRPIMRWIANTHLKEMFTAFSLLLVVGIAEVMTLANLSMAMGAFLAGVLLASSEYRHALESDIEPFKGLLLGLFFISVGMSINLNLIGEQPLMIAGLFIGLIVIKTFALWLCSRFMDIHVQQRWLFAAILSQGGEFGFVVFGAARMANVLSPQWEALLNITIALSMASTPFLLLLIDRLNTTPDSQSTPEHDPIDQTAPVIIAGFGRVGQIVGRLLLANQVPVTVLDHDPDQIDTLRKFGYKVFFGDVTRLDLLHAAGLEQAQLLINAIDDVDDSLLLTELVQQHFPHVKMVARARNVTHYLALREKGITVVERETFEAALRLGRRALENLNIGAYRAKEMADLFRRHNVQTLEKLREVIQDETRLMSSAKAGREELETLFEQDRARLDKEHPKHWD